MASDGREHWEPRAALARLRPPWPVGPLTLRPWSASDAPALQAMRDGDPDVVRFTPVPQPSSLADARATIAKRDGMWEHGAGASFAIVDRASATVVGDVTLSVQEDVARTLELGYLVDAGWRGRGIATAVLIVVRGRAHEVGFRRLVLEIDPRNRASVVVAERAGFALERAGRAVLAERGGTVDARYVSVATAPG